MGGVGRDWVVVLLFAFRPCLLLFVVAALVYNRRSSASSDKIRQA